MVQNPNPIIHLTYFANKKYFNQFYKQNLSPNFPPRIPDPQFTPLPNSDSRRRSIRPYGPYSLRPSYQIPTTFPHLNPDSFLFSHRSNRSIRSVVLLVVSSLDSRPIGLLPTPIVAPHPLLQSPASSHSRSFPESRTQLAADGLVLEKKKPNPNLQSQRSTVHSSPAAFHFFSGMGLWTFLEGILLVVNALAILNEDRFLSPRGWSFSEISANGRAKSLKGQVLGLIYATQYMRMPLIALNLAVVVIKLLSG